MIDWQIEIDTGKSLLFIQNIQSNISDFTESFIQIHAYMQSIINMQFADLSGDIRGGGDARGVHWDYFASQYTRKDGTVVPAWGIPGEVQGRLRHSGQRVKLGDSIMQDTGLMRSQILEQKSILPNMMVMNTGGDQKKLLCQHSMRSFQFFQEPVDVDNIRDIILNKILNI